MAGFFLSLGWRCTDRKETTEEEEEEKRRRRRRKGRDRKWSFRKRSRKKKKGGELFVPFLEPPPLLSLFPLGCANSVSAPPPPASFQKPVGGGGGMAPLNSRNCRMQHQITKQKVSLLLLILFLFRSSVAFSPPKTASSPTFKTRLVLEYSSSFLLL